MTEETLVEAFAALAGRNARVTLGIGDDAAAWQPSRSMRSVISTDALVQDVHFSLAWMSPHEVGVRAMVANASDLAAMGARPVLATVSLCIPPDMDQAAVIDCFRGIAETARAYGAAIAGGDLSRSPVLMISITVVGEVRPTHLKRRDGARPGDVIAVTGPLGAARAGLEARRFPPPVARVAEGRFLGASRNVHAMMDCSDGLSTDLARMARASGVGVRIDAVPLGAGVDSAETALAGGEDYELIVAVGARAFGHLAARYLARFGRPLLRVGTFEADERLLVVKQGALVPLERTGWEHFT